MINDFALGTDRIDLRAIDANPGTLGDQAFVFVGSAAFTAVGQAIRDANVATAELQNRLQGSPVLTAASLLL